MHLEILNEDQKKLIPLVSQFGRQYYLVGGTALALQWGHRRSIDFDLFRQDSFDGKRIMRKVSQDWRVEAVYVSSKDELTMRVEGVKMTWYRYEFEIPLTVKWPEVIKMPDPLHIAAMKAYALGHRAKWKDYVDLYFAFQKYSLREVVDLATKLFGEGLFDERLLREQLAYYEDVSFKEEVEFMSGWEVSEEEVKRFLTEVAVE